MNTEWTQDEMFPVPSGVWVQIGLSISGEEQEIEAPDDTPPAPRRMRFRFNQEADA